MCGFTGFASFEKDISKDKDILEKMNLKFKKRETEEESFYINKYIGLANCRLNVIDNESEKQPMSIKYDNTTYTIVYDGKIYNKEEIRKELIDIGYEFTGYSDTEVLLKAFMHFGTDILKRLNGVFSFAIWNYKKEELYLVRDHFGIKPLYYTILNNTIVFATEIKAILEYPEINIELDSMGIAEMFGLRSCTYSGNMCV